MINDIKVERGYVNIRFFTFIEKSFLNSETDVHDFLFAIFRFLFLIRFLRGRLNLLLTSILVVGEENACLIFGFGPGFLRSLVAPFCSGLLDFRFFVCCTTTADFLNQ
jgi:hypothetical protein